MHPLIFLFKLNISSLIIIIGLDTCTWLNQINQYLKVFLFLIKWKSILITFGSMTQIETRHFFWAAIVHMFSKKTRAVVYWFLNSIICKYIRNTFYTNIYKLLLFFFKRHVVRDVVILMTKKRNIFKYIHRDSTWAPDFSTKLSKKN